MKNSNYFNNTQNISDAVNKLALVFNAEIDDEYDAGCTIRTVEIVEKKSKSRLFNEKEIHLKPYSKTKESIVVANAISGQEVEIIAIEYKES